jgi:hypothetical protein
MTFARVFALFADCRQCFLDRHGGVNERRYLARNQCQVGGTERAANRE